MPLSAWHPGTAAGPIRDEPAATRRTGTRRLIVLSFSTPQANARRSFAAARV
ncbi:hypothetical protein GCM10007890_08970 [Methylobacterium tardum]|uniref:Uncharacterized protein n=1 Tax=Methylobacterium tardum TaxID=374432 RepID=A0AA37T8F7_9HYPH|nr:hypothetical protein GCM10007890_08970 [Methylobacterium tardum]